MYLGKTFADFASLKVLKKAIAQKIHWENFQVYLKMFLQKFSLALLMSFAVSISSILCFLSSRLLY